jgi:hypothetical protein
MNRRALLRALVSAAPAAASPAALVRLLIAAEPLALTGAEHTGRTMPVFSVRFLFEEQVLPRTCKLRLFRDTYFGPIEVS